jgi:hypothetical protein
VVGIGFLILDDVAGGIKFDPGYAIDFAVEFCFFFFGECYPGHLVLDFPDLLIQFFCGHFLQLFVRFFVAFVFVLDYSDIIEGLFD